MMTMYQVDLPAAVIGFADVHLSLRNETDGIRQLAESGDRKMAASRARLLARVLGIHHHTEDNLLWPALEARHPGFEVTTAELEDQHRQLDVALQVLPWRLDSIDEVGDLLEVHLLAEEARALPVW